jgi:hypothetical protein
MELGECGLRHATGVEEMGRRTLFLLLSFLCRYQALAELFLLLSKACCVLGRDIG